MIKKLFFLVSLIFLSGCTINYNLNIDKDNLIEDISGTVTDDEIIPEVEGKSDVNPKYYYLYLDDSALISDNNEKYIKNITDIENGKKFNFNYTYKNNYDKSKIINSCFEKHMVNETDTYYSIELKGEFYCLYSDRIDVNVISNYVVLENNAKEVNGNKYSWVIDNSNNVNISLTISKEVKYEEPSKTKFISTFQLIGLIIFVVLTGITYFLYRKKNSGKV